MSDSEKSLFIKLLVMGLTGLATYLHANVPDAQMVAISTDIVDLTVLGFGVYRSLGMKLVPHEAIAISPDHVANSETAISSGTALVIGKETNTNAVAVKVVGCLLGAFFVTQLALVSHASAQGLPKAAQAQSAFLTTIQKWISTDNAAAIALATSIPDLQDPIGAACWKTFAGLGEVVQKHPLPLTLRLASDIEAARLIQMAIKKVCAAPECNQVWNDMQNQVVALAPISTPFTLASICSKVL